MSINKEELIGRIITLESVQHEGYYTACNQPGKYLDCTPTTPAKLATSDTKWTRLKVHKVDDDTIALESIRFPNCYVYAHAATDPAYATTYITEYSSPPLDSTTVKNQMAHWKLANVTGYGRNVFSLESCFHPNLFLNPDGRHCVVVPMPTLHPLKFVDNRQDGLQASPRWKLGIGPYRPEPESHDVINDEYINIAGHKNPLDTKADFTYKKVVGVTAPGKDPIIVARYGMLDEMHVNFTAGPLELNPKDSAFSIKYSSDWATSSSKTWGLAAEVEIKVKVPPKKKVVVLQLTGTCTPYKIHSDHVRLEYDDLD